MLALILLIYRLLGNECGEYASSNFPEDPSCPIQKVGHELKSETILTTWIAGKWLGGIFIFDLNQASGKQTLGLEIRDWQTLF